LCCCRWRPDHVDNIRPADAGSVINRRLYSSTPIAALIDVFSAEYARSTLYDPDNRSLGGPALPRTTARVPNTTGHGTPLDAATQQQRRLRVMRWTSVMRDGTWDGPLYGSSERRERNIRRRDQAVARTAAGTRRLIWSQLLGRLGPHHRKNGRRSFRTLGGLGKRLRSTTGSNTRHGWRRSGRHRPGIH
jgi:hypothetical protein